VLRWSVRPLVRDFQSFRHLNSAVSSTTVCTMHTSISNSSLSRIAEFTDFFATPDDCHLTNVRDDEPTATGRVGGLRRSDR